MVELDVISLVALFAVTVIGLPHGAMDAAVALALGYGSHAGRMAMFVLLYLILAAAVIGFWILAPVTALLLFLLISLAHFGLGDTEETHIWTKLVQMMAHGSIVTVAIPFWHRDEVTVLFQALSGDHGVIWPVINGAAILAVLAGLAYAVMAVGNKHLRKGLAEYVVLNVLVAVLPPLAGFAIYFTAIHTPRHLFRITAALRDRLPSFNVWGMTASFTIATWAMAGLAFWALAGRIGADTATLQIVFIGLAALTVPHMILIDGVFRPGLKQT